MRARHTTIGGVGSGSLPTADVPRIKVTGGDQSRRDRKKEARRTPSQELARIIDRKMRRNQMSPSDRCARVRVDQVKVI